MGFQNIETPKSSLLSTFGSVKLSRPGNGVVFLGDSITLGSDSASSVYRGDAWPVWASLLSLRQVGYLHNAGVTGNTSAQMLARFDTDVTPYAPSAVTIAAGMNDAATGVTAATFRANILALVAKCHSIGAAPILCTVTPSTASPATRDDLICAYNTWLRRYTRDNGFILLDFYPLLVDTTTGALASAHDAGDGIHPIEAARKVLGQYVATTLANVTPPRTPPLAAANADPLNLVTNGLHITDTNSDGLADGWGVYSGPDGAAYSLVTATGMLGSAQRITCTATAATTWLYRTISTGFSVGDVLGFGALVASSNIAPEIQIKFVGPDTNAYPIKVTSAISLGAMWEEMTVPAGTTSIQVFLKATAGTGTADFGQVTLYNLTTMGAI